MYKIMPFEPQVGFYSPMKTWRQDIALVLFNCDPISNETALLIVAECSRNFLERVKLVLYAKTLIRTDTKALCVFLVFYCSC